MSTTATVIDLDTDTEHKALQYIAQVLGQTQKATALDIFQRGLAALGEDPEWQAQVDAHEAQRSNTLATLGLDRKAPAVNPLPAQDASDGDQPTTLGG